MSAAAALTAARTPREGARRNGGSLGLLALAVRTEVAASLRSGQFVVGIIAVPVILYAMFALPAGSQQLPGGTSIATLALASFAAYAAVSSGIFICGEAVAGERRRGWTRTLAATPLPRWVHLGAKVAVTGVSGLLAAGCLVVVAVLAGGVRLEAWQWVGFAAVVLAGAAAFSTLGLAIAYLVRPKVAIVLANLVFLPLSFCSGFFIPLSQLPDVLGDAAPYLPTHHLGQLLWRQVAPPGDVLAFTGAPLAPVAVSVAAVAGCFLVCGLLAGWAARREAVTRRG